MDSERCKLAIIATHPIQYYSPWFADLARDPRLDVRVFYLLEPRAEGLFDKGFQRVVKWDLALLEGFASEFVPNTSRDPGTHRFGGLRNPMLARRVRAFGPAAVLLMGYNFASLLGFILTWNRRRAPMLFRGDSHRLVESSSPAAAIKRALIAALFSRISAFLYVGKANFRYFRRHGVRETALFYAPHAVDNERFAREGERLRKEALAWRSELGIPPDHVLFLFAGKLEEKKEPAALLEAFRALAQRGASLLFVGNGPLEPQLRAAASGLQHVHFAPFQNQGAMPRVYAACDVLVLPSRGPSETWGLAVNEAMAVGKPAIVSSHVGCAEDLVLPERTGLVFPAGDAAALRRTLETALERRSSLPQWGEAARAHVAQYGYRQATEGVVQALEALGRFRSGRTAP